MSIPVTEQFANFIVNTDYKAIPEKAIRSAKLHILDTIGVALASVSYPAGQIALANARRLRGSPDVTVWGSSLKTSVSVAAFTNGFLAHSIDFDDWNALLHSGHSSCMVVASALSLGEDTHASGKDLLKAYVLGIEILTQIASGSPDIHKRGFHSTPIFGCMGSVAAAASIVGLTPDKIKAAFGITASGASGIHLQNGTMVKPYHAGNSARNGVEAVLLADAGFTADDAIIENPRGFCDTFFGDGSCNYQSMLNGLGDPFYMESPSLAFKKYPCSTPQFLAADATLHLVEHHNINYEDVSKVELKISPARHNRHYSPSVRSGLHGKFLINYVTAMAVLEGKLVKNSFTDAKVSDPKVQEAFGKVKVIVDSNIPEKGEYCPVTIELKDGTRVSHTATIPRGHPENPVTEAEVLDKFRDNTKDMISQQRCDELITSLMNLEGFSNVQELAKLLISK